MTERKTITVRGMFGKDKQVTKEDYVRIWTNHAKDLMEFGIDIADEVAEKAGDRWEHHWEKQNA